MSTTTGYDANRSQGLPPTHVLSSGLSPEVIERRAMLRWVGFILFLLIGSVGMWIYAAILAVSDPSMAVVPDYHEKALHWEEHMAMQKVSDQLGWTIHVIVGSTKGEAPDEKGQRNITLFARDREAKPVVGGKAQLRFYHFARAAKPTVVDLIETEPGSYETEVTMNRDGRWHFDFSMDRGEEHFEWSESKELELR